MLGVRLSFNMTRSILVIVCFAVAMLAGFRAEAITYVRKNGPATGANGQSWATAFQTLQPGINAAASDADHEVWVAEGDYGELRSSASGSLVMASGVSVYGGFAGTETQRAQRNAKTHVTTISGAKSRSGSAAYHVVIGAASATLDGFAITGGIASGSGTLDSYGGGLLLDTVSSTISNCVFYQNEASFGGAIYAANGSPLILNCIFLDNLIPTAGKTDNLTEKFTLIGLGAGVYLSNCTGASLTNCFFSNNQNLSGAGGALVTIGTTVTVSRSRFFGNKAASSGGAVIASTTNATFTNCAFYSNESTGSSGGAITNVSGKTQVINCSFAKNRSTASTPNGGAVYSAPEAVTELVNVVAWHNTPNSLFDEAGATVTVSYSDIEEGRVGTGNIAADPKFAGEVSGNLRLSYSSPCVDQGTAAQAPSTDLTGLPRPAGAGVDMGAFELGAGTDSDGDGIPDEVELNRTHTDPLNPDSDGDGMPDGFEMLYRIGASLNPNDPSDADNDTDGDGFTNLEEYQHRSDPSNPNSPRVAFFVAPTGVDVPGRGTRTAPWQTIAYAITQIQGGNAAKTPASVSIVLAPGTYTENVALLPDMILAGSRLGTAIVAGPGPTIVRGDVNASIRNLRIQQDAGLSGATVLLDMAGAAMQVAHVDFMGNAQKQALGIVDTSPDQTASLITDCRFTSVANGVVIGDDTPTVRRSVFDQISGNGILVQTAPPKTEARTKSLGDATDPNTGYNAFKAIGGKAVLNQRAVMLQMQNNNWGTDQALEIANKIQGPVNYTPYLASNVFPFSAKSASKGIVIPGSIVCSVWNADTVGAVTNAAVALTPLGFSVTDNTQGVYAFASVPSNVYTLTVSAPGFQDSAPKLVSVSDGMTEAISVTLSADSVSVDSDGDGLSDGEEATIGTNPLNVDTDGDGVDDDVEVAYGSNPLVVDLTLTADVNSDGAVDAIDVQMVINAALGIPVTGAPDINRDSSVDAIDVQLAINGALGL